VSTPATLPTRPTAWQSSLAASPAVTLSTSTDDPLLSTTTAPTATLVIVFGGKSTAPFVAPRAPSPALSFTKWHPRQSAEEIEPAAPTTELIIDSLPHHQLIEPIPVTIDLVGDALCTATVHNLDISATGSSIGDALLLLKAQVEFVYDGLSGRRHLSSDQKTVLQTLHTYIAAQPAKLEWPSSREFPKALASLAPQPGAPFCPAYPDAPTRQVKR
jgi:hypothetical protein